MQKQLKIKLLSQYFRLINDTKSIMHINLEFKKIKHYTDVALKATFFVSINFAVKNTLVMRIRIFFFTAILKYFITCTVLLNIKSRNFFFKKINNIDLSC